jgi:hypothetical protein
LDFDDIGDACDDDADGDGVPTLIDLDDLNPFSCADFDRDTCDDCSIDGRPNQSNDGQDTDGDGLCDAGDPE